MIVSIKQETKNIRVNASILVSLSRLNNDIQPSAMYSDWIERDGAINVIVKKKTSLLPLKNVRMCSFQRH